MARTVERFYVQSTVAQTTMSPAAVYKTATNLETLPRWWFGCDPSSKMWDGTRVLRAVEDAGMVAFPGVSVDVVSSGAKNHFAGKKRWTESPSVLRFTCEIAEPDSRLRLLHKPIHGDTWRVKVSTEIKTVAARGLRSDGPDLRPHQPAATDRAAGRLRWRQRSWMSSRRTTTIALRGVAGGASIDRARDCVVGRTAARRDDRGGCCDGWRGRLGGGRAAIDGRRGVPAPSAVR